MYQRRSDNSPPSWFVFLLGIALIFGVYYLWNNLREFFQAGGLSVSEATRAAQLDVTATLNRQEILQLELPTRRPTSTERPPCQDFEVLAESGIMRQAASTAAPIVESVIRGTTVCVLGSERGGEGFIWYLIDRDAITRRIEVVYMREDILRSLNPTPTPSITPPPLPSITAIPTRTVSPTLNPETPIVRSTRQSSQPIQNTPSPSPSSTEANSSPTLTPTPPRIGI